MFIHRGIPEGREASRMVGSKGPEHTPIVVGSDVREDVVRPPRAIPVVVLVRRVHA